MVIFFTAKISPTAANSFVIFIQYFYFTPFQANCQAVGGNLPPTAGQPAPAARMKKISYRFLPESVRDASFSRTAYGKNTGVFPSLTLPVPLRRKFSAWWQLPVPDVQAMLPVPSHPNRRHCATERRRSGFQLPYHQW